MDKFLSSVGSFAMLVDVEAFLFHALADSQSVAFLNGFEDYESH